MFPSSGYFRSITCPYFNNGLCERPHCHFRHVKSDTTIQVPQQLPRPAVDVTSSLSSHYNGGDGKPDLLALVREAILQVQKEVEEDKLKSSTTSATSNKLSTNGEHKLNISRNCTADAATVAVRGSSDFSKKDKSSSKQPEYKPTPIAELKKLQDHQKSSSGGGLEYDPTERYTPGTSKQVESTEYKPSKIAHATAPKTKSKKAIEYVPSSTPCENKADNIDNLESSPEIERNSPFDANFSDDNEDDNLNATAQNSNFKAVVETDETTKPNSSSGTNFDLVNMILTESKMCNSLINAASARKESRFKTSKSEKSTKPIKTTKTTSDDSQKSSSAGNSSSKVSDKSLKKKKSSSDTSSSNKIHSSSKSSSSSSNVKLKPEGKLKLDKHKSDSKIKIRVVKVDNSKSSNGSDSKKGGESSSKKSSSDKKTVSKSSKTDRVSADNFKITPKGSNSKKHTIQEGGKHIDHNKSSKKEHSSNKSSSNSKHKSPTNKHKVSSDVKKKQPKPDTNVIKDKDATKTSTEMQPPAAIRESPLNKSLKMIKCTSEGETSGSSPFISDDLDTDLDEHDTYEECLRIFNEYVPEVEQDNTHNIKKSVAKDVLEEVESYPIGKKRIAHDAGLAPPKKPKMFPHAQPAPALIMHNRLAQIQKMMQDNKTTPIESQTPTTLAPLSPQASSSAFLSTVDLSTSGKKRIAHVPNSLTSTSQSTLNYGLSSAPTARKVEDPSATNPTTAAHTVAKGVKRLAHVPTMTTLKRPIILPEYGSRVPVNIRQRYLNLLIDECLKIYDCEQDAFDRGLAEEKNSYERSSTRTVYLNVVANAIKRLRNEREGIIPLSPLTKPETNHSPAAPPNSVTTQPHRPLPPKQTISHEFVLGGKKAANVSYSIERPKHKVNDAPLTDAKMYKALQPYILTKKQLEDNGFPVPHPTEPNKIVILKQDTKNMKKTDSLDRICCRCGSSFKVNSKGIYITKAECFYHWGRPYKVRSAGMWETRYSCCQGGSHSEGCCVGKLHVFDDVDYNHLKGFVKTLPKSPPLDGNCGVYALDCEMCYTNMGSELTRVTVIGVDLKPVYESFVKPENPVIDYNTRFSGITEDDLSPVKTTIRDVQAVILNLFNDQTILIGHSLESDFKALKLVHQTVVDTSLVFPHRRGPPFKRALRNLSAEYLKKIIQNDVNGHDSQEDASACMELMLMKVKEDLKKNY